MGNISGAVWVKQAPHFCKKNAIDLLKVIPQPQNTLWICSNSTLIHECGVNHVLREMTHKLSTENTWYTQYQLLTTEEISENINPVL